MLNKSALQSQDAQTRVIEATKQVLTNTSSAYTQYMSSAAVMNSKLEMIVNISQMPTGFDVQRATDALNQMSKMLQQQEQTGDIIKLVGEVAAVGKFI